MKLTVTVPRMAELLAPLDSLAAAVAPLAAAAERAREAIAPLATGIEKLSADVLASAVAGAEDEAERIRAGIRSGYVAQTARLLPPTHPDHAAIAALAEAQRPAVPAALEDTHSRALHELSEADNTRSLTAVLTARDLGHVIPPHTAWIHRRPLSPRAPAPARLA